ncbi:NAD-dependent epimerase/dehydratase family protein [Vibrio caribbeanicus]|uniref:NAD-dependent epimerase/dehydratase family protein n=1 Tax=Vibrio caribbeanicus TaxID=701175 RepID=UPI0022845014|nr:NAD-dependent epimerase/dehydratase family protein [Vibrio caribbeanicus]MCY9844255.1 NAD-dependent epimerase/dehydratase family protein [Vibrio caribbeanicus]
MKVAITGATGFVGNYILEALCKSYTPLVLGRSKPNGYNGNYESYDLLEQNNLPSLVDVEVIIHSAARVHLMNETAKDPLSEYQAANTEATLRLANHAVASGVKRFIFLSTIKVNGESTHLEHPFCHDSAPVPQCDYAKSKFEAESGLLKLAEQTGLEVVIIRPTLVYGPGVKANFALLLNIVKKGYPLPFGCIDKNRRSFVSVDNLVDLVITCIEHTRAPGEVFLVSDDCDISTSEMVRLMGVCLSKRNLQIPIPIWFFKLVGRILGKSEVVYRLTGSLQVDISHTKKTLDWIPPETILQSFKKVAVNDDR